MIKIKSGQSGERSCCYDFGWFDEDVKRDLQFVAFQQVPDIPMHSTTMSSSQGLTLQCHAYMIDFLKVFSHQAKQYHKELAARQLT